jgi:tetratricopeptide (TPR) repeat protein
VGTGREPDSGYGAGTGRESVTGSGPGTGRTTGSADQVSRDQVYALLGDSVTVSLRGEGWIFLGEKNNKEGISFLTRKRAAGNSDFLFQVERRDDYLLQFQQQRPQSGTIDVKVVEVNVVTEEEFSEYVGRRAEESLETQSTEEGGDYSLAERLYRNGRREDALSEYLRQYREGRPEINQRIAELSLEFARYNDATRFWKKNSDLEGELRKKAIQGLIEVALRLEDQQMLDQYLDELLAIKGLDIGEQLFGAARMEEENGYLEEAVVLYNTIVERYPNSDFLDRVYYSLGRIYEKKSTIQDVEMAINYYTIVVEQYPASRHWNQAQNRRDYLNRYYFQIR